MYRKRPRKRTYWSAWLGPRADDRFLDHASCTDGPLEPWEG